jgi:hypothetical protein
MTLSVGSDADEHLQWVQGIKDEITSWLSDLKATVRTVSVEPVSEEKKR